MESVPTEQRLTIIFIYCFNLELLTWLRRRNIYFFSRFFFIFRKHKFPFKHHHEQIGQLIWNQKLLSYPHLHIQYRKYNWKNIYVCNFPRMHLHLFFCYAWLWLMCLFGSFWVEKTNQSNDFYRYWFKLLSVSAFTRQTILFEFILKSIVLVDAFDIFRWTFFFLYILFCTNSKYLWKILI